MKEQKVRARAARANISGWSNASKTLLADLPKTEFVGYESFVTEAKIIALIVDDMSVNEVSEGDVTVILDKTTCYGEGGGQVGDTAQLPTMSSACLLTSMTLRSPTVCTFI